MKEEKNINLLDDLNKGCCMGRDAVSYVVEKIEGKSFKKEVEKLLEKYEDLEEKINKVYTKYSDGEPRETTIMNKVMTWYGINIRTLKDTSATKLAEMLLQGLNMGIIDGKKLLNHEDADKKVIGLIKDYVDMQEKYVEKIKEFL